MHTIENTGAIVVGVDGSAAAMNATRWAAAVATRYETSLHIVYATTRFGPNLTETAAAIRAAIMSYQRDCASVYLREAADAARSQYPGLDVTTLSVNSPVDDALVQFGGRSRMIVVGGSHVTPAGAALIGSTTLAVATHANCPVVALRGPMTVPTDQPVVVGVDGTPSSAAALEAAFTFADRFRGKISAVRPWSVPWPAAAMTGPILIDQDALEAAEWACLVGEVDRCNKRYEHVSASCFVEPTKPTASLLHQIEADGAQLVVVGSRGRNALASAVLGSTALNLLHHSTVPVMICRAPQEGSLTH